MITGFSNQLALVAAVYGVKIGRASCRERV